MIYSHCGHVCVQISADCLVPTAMRVVPLLCAVSSAPLPPHDDHSPQPRRLIGQTGLTPTGAGPLTRRTSLIRSGLHPPRTLRPSAFRQTGSLRSR